MKPNAFDVLKEMGKRNMDVRLSPLDNITNLNYRRKVNGTDVTIGVAGNVVGELGIDNRFVGGLILADKDQFRQVEAELASLIDSPPLP